MAPLQGADELLAVPFHKFLNNLLPILSVKATADNQDFNCEILVRSPEIFVKAFHSRMPN